MAQRIRATGRTEASARIRMSEAPEVLQHHEAGHHEAGHHEEHPHVDLSEDEAAALAEHVAEAQIEEAAREAQNRDLRRG